MIHLDTNFLIAALNPFTPEAQKLDSWTLAKESIGISSIAWTEFLCGPVTPEEVRSAAIYFPNPEAFQAQDAHVAADWFNQTGRRRGSLPDCMIAAVSHRVGARLATINVADFRVFVPFGLVLA
jgi:predicted nucleic acid-binding protein